MSLKFDNQECIDPGPLLAACQERGWPTWWAGKANSYTCPLGEETGVGYILLPQKSVTALEETIDNLVTFGGHTLEFVEESSNKKETFKLYNLHIVKAMFASPSYEDDDPNSIWLLELADERVYYSKNKGDTISQQSTIYYTDLASQYSIANYRTKHRGQLTGDNNTLYPSAKTILNSSGQMTWRVLLDALFQLSIYGNKSYEPSSLTDSPDFPQGFTEPESPPLNIKIMGMPSWALYNSILKQLGLAFKLNPTKQFPSNLSNLKSSNRYTLVKLGDSTNEEVSEFQSKNKKTRLYYSNTKRNVFEHVPYQLGIRFHSREFKSNRDITNGTEEYHENIDRYPFYEVSKNSNSIDAEAPSTSSVAFTKDEIWDLLPVENDTNTDYNNPGDGILNKDHLLAQATNRATYYINERLYHNTGLHEIYSGIHNILPGSNLSYVSWYDIGHGIKTEIACKPMRLNPTGYYDDSLYNKILTDENPGPPDLARRHLPHFQLRIGIITRSIQDSFNAGQYGANVSVLLAECIPPSEIFGFGTYSEIREKINTVTVGQVNALNLNRGFFFPDDIVFILHDLNFDDYFILDAGNIYETAVATKDIAYDETTNVNIEREDAGYTITVLAKARFGPVVNGSRMGLTWNRMNLVWDITETKCN